MASDGFAGLLASRALRWLVVRIVVLLAPCMPAGAAVTYIPPADGSLAACYFGNNTGLSSTGCYCLSNLECVTGICSVSLRLCNSTLSPPACAPLGNGKGASAGGCPCQSNLDCVTGICPITPPAGETTSLCTSAFGPLTSPIPAVCLLGNTHNISADGCPCVASNECKGACSTITGTCGGLVGKVVARQSGIVANPVATQIQLGGSTTDIATLSNTARADSGQIQFRLYPPGTDPCAAVLPTPVYTRNITSTGNTLYSSGPFLPAALGTYQWTAGYTGNAFNLAASSGCALTAQQVRVVDEVFRNGFE